MKTMTIEQALAAGLTQAARCADCGAEGYETATPDGDLLQDGRLIALEGNPEILCASKHSPSDLVCEDCEQARDEAKRGPAMTTETTQTHETLAQQAVEGLDVTMAAGLVRVQDGEDTWLTTLPAWDAALGEMGRKPYEDEDGSAGAQAYGRLCELVSQHARMQGSAVITLIGSPSGSKRARRDLARKAAKAGIIESSRIAEYL